MVLVGVLLVSGVALMTVESVGYVRGGYNGSFWRLPLDEKLDHVAAHPRDWWWISIWSVVGLFTVTAGVFGLAGMLADAGEPVLAYVSLGGFTIAALGWFFGLSVQTTAVSEAAGQRAETGATPAWVHPLWNAAFLTELVYITGSNAAYSLMGLGILRSDLVADWAGWLALIGGAVIAAVVLAMREGFPQLGYLLPAAIGIALLIQAA